MIIWSKGGILVIVFAIVSVLLVSQIGIENENTELSISLLLAGGITFFTGRSMGPEHTFFFIPMKYWGIVFMVISAYFFFFG